MSLPVPPPPHQPPKQPGITEAGLKSRAAAKAIRAYAQLAGCLLAVAVFEVMMTNSSVNLAVVAQKTIFVLGFAALIGVTFAGLHHVRAVRLNTTIAKLIPKRRLRSSNRRTAATQTGVSPNRATP
ncbi:MAG: hypothetical protein AB8B51_12350 [Sedimentitalea sp.]